MSKNENLRGIIAAIGLKVGAAICTFLLFSLMSNSRSTDEFGSFAIIWSAASMMTVLAAFGQEMMVIRAWNEHGEELLVVWLLALIIGLRKTPFWG